MTEPSRRHGKLVRDLIPDIIRRSGGNPVTRVLEDSEFQEALAKKLNEEVAELQNADSAGKLEEIADVYEVLLTIASLEGHSLADVQRVASAKRSDRGGFAHRIWLEQPSR